MSAFKAYDIRGVVGRDLDTDLVYRVGRCLPAMLEKGTVLVGRDARTSSPALCDALCRGLTDAGADVEDIGLCTTPMVYYFTGVSGCAGSVMITASHNPPAHNGLKLSRRGAVPIGGDTGLRELKKMVSAALSLPAGQPGKLQRTDRSGDYIAFLKERLPDLDGLRFGIDSSNGMAALFARRVFGESALYLHDEVDGSFPNHSPNPLEDKAREDIRHLVLEHKLDVGVIFDGDADRVMFLDENGHFIRPDLLIALLADAYLKKEPGAGILYDIRTSRGVTEAIRKRGGVPHMWKVGHAFAKVRMRELNTIVGGELAGHYYFREFFNCDAGILCAQIILGEIARARRKGQKFSELLAEVDKYANTGERNFKIEDKEAAMEALRNWASSGREPEAQYDFDGYRYEWSDWWFNVRPSNTEPYLRVICEAETETLLLEKFTTIQKILAPFVSI